MTPSFIDTHAHLHLLSPQLREEVILRAKKTGVKKIVNVACNLKEIKQCLSLANEHEFIWTTVGIHPTDLTDSMGRDLKQVEKIARETKKIVAIGEIGLDYYHDRFPHDVQKAFLTGQLEIAQKLGLPAILHCRAGKNPGENEAAFGDLIEVLEELRFKNAVAHCFSGNPLEAEKLLDMGLMLSFTGVITYPQNEVLRDIVRTTPLDRIMIETDSPFLTPSAHRGKKNEPAFVVEVAKMIAKVKGVPFEEVARMTSANAEQFFKI